MREPIDAKQLAKVAGVSGRDISTYRKRRLLDLDGDGQLDEMDVLRLRLLMHYRSLGMSVDELADAIGSGSKDVLYSELLWGPDEDSITAQEAAERVGIPIEAVQSLLRAIGLGTSIPSKDVKFLETVRSLVDGGIPLKMILDVGRVYGDTMRRLAQAEVKMIREFLSETTPKRGEGATVKSSLLKDREQSERLRTVQDLVAPILEPLLLTVHRRHMLRSSIEEALADLEAAERGEDRDALEATIVFVDLASFTSLARVHGDEVAADTLDRFDALVRRLLEEHNGTLIKQIGDAFMLVFTEPLPALEFAVHLDAAASSEPNFPAVRTGINTGPVLYRVGDYVGNTVNIAARIAALASANEIYVTQEFADLVQDGGIALESAGRFELSGVETPVELWRVDRRSAYAPERDPVCGMAVGDDPAARLRYQDVNYAFCSPACLRIFLEDPERHAVPVSREAKPEL